MLSQRSKVVPGLRTQSAESLPYRQVAKKKCRRAWSVLPFVGDGVPGKTWQRQLLQLGSIRH